MARNLRCDPPDGAHASRSANTGWRNTVGTRTDINTGPDDLLGHGMMCAACRVAVEAAALAAEATARTARMAALNKLRNFGGASGATPLTVAEMRLIFDAREKGDT